MPENITWRGGTQSGERELPAAPHRRLARGETAGRLRLRARQGHMICSSAQLSSTRIPISLGAATGNLAMLVSSNLAHRRS